MTVKGGFALAKNEECPDCACFGAAATVPPQRVAVLPPVRRVCILQVADHLEAGDFPRGANFLSRKARAIGEPGTISMLVLVLKKHQATETKGQINESQRAMDQTEMLLRRSSGLVLDPLFVGTYLVLGACGF